MDEYLKAGYSVFHGAKPNSRNHRTPQETAFFDAIDRRREDRCRVYWGGHGCDTPAGTPHGTHRCWCGRMNTEDSVLWGDDVTEEEKLRNVRARDVQAWLEQLKAGTVKSTIKPNRRRARE